MIARGNVRPSRSIPRWLDYEYGACWIGSRVSDDCPTNGREGRSHQLELFGATGTNAPLCTAKASIVLPMPPVGSVAYSRADTRIRGAGICMALMSFAPWNGCDFRLDKNQGSDIHPGESIFCVHACHKVRNQGN